MLLAKGTISNMNACVVLVYLRWSFYAYCILNEDHGELASMVASLLGCILSFNWILHMNC